MSSIKRNLVYNFILSGSQLLVPLISIPYISRVLMPDGIGRVSFIDSFTFYFISIAEFGIMVYGMREVARARNNQEDLGKLVSELMALHMITSLLSLLLYGIAVYFVWDKIHDPRLLLFSVSFLLVGFFSCEWYFFGMEEFRYITFRSIATRIAGLISIFVLLKSPSDYYVYYAIIVTTAIANSIWNNVLLFRRIKISFAGIHWKRHLSFMWVIFLMDIFYSIPLMLDNVFLRFVSTETAVGLYAFTMKMAKVSSVLITDTLIVFFPRIISLIKNGNEGGLRATVLQNIQLIIFFSVPVSAGMFLLSGQIISVFLGKNFLSATGDLRILSIYPFLKAYSLFLSKQILISHNREKLFLKSTIISAAVFIVLTLVLSFLFADKGACSAIIITEMNGLLINYFYAKKTNMRLKIFDWKCFFQSICGALIFVPVIYAIKRMDMAEEFSLMLSVLVCFMLYVIFQVFIMRNEFVLQLKTSVQFFFRNKKLN
ncbi:MAG: oligosaccharide flippase family protein [Bacteroidetes bacterium]|nr:oligosaccharide flippase family protein [Bacteroidota bacterium]